MTAWLVCKKGIAGVSDRDLISHATEVAIEMYDLQKQATEHGGLGPSTSWPVHMALYRERLDFLRAEMILRGLADEE